MAQRRGAARAAAHRGVEPIAIDDAAGPARAMPS
jgi:hypothetical protein